MGKLVDYKCRYADFRGTDSEILDRLGLKRPDVFMKSADMAAYAGALREKTGAPYCKLPFDTFVEGEAMGAQLVYDDSISGPRKGEDVVKDPKDILDLPVLDPAKGRVPEIFSACDQLRTGGDRTIIEVRGLFDIMNSLTDIQGVMMLWIREPDTMKAICDRIREGLVKYMSAACQHSDMMFYSDASGGINVIGPRFGKQMVEWFTYPLMKELQGVLKDGHRLQMYPKTSFMLTGCDKAKFVDIPAPEAASYAESCMMLPEDIQFLGQRCNREFATEPGDTITYMELY